MSNLKERIQKDLKRQQGLEGPTSETGLLLRVLPFVTTKLEWQMLTKAGGYRYGKLSYETYRFWYPSELLVNLQDFFISNHEGF